MAKKILVANSDPFFSEALEKRLKNLGIDNFTIINASDGQEALRKARRENPDLIIAEENLYSIDGYKLSRLVKFDKRRRHIPFILLYAHLDEQNQALAKEVGADDYLPHSIDQRFLSKIKFCLSGEG